MTPLTNCPKCGSNDLATDHTGLAPGHKEDLEQWCKEPDCEWYSRLQDNSDEDDDYTTVDLTGLSKPARVLHKHLSEILSGETSILAPDDAENLALAIVTQLPNVYAQADDLLAALQNCHAFIQTLLNATADETADFLTNNGESVEDLAFDAIAKANGEQS